ncbi:hypothetical protein O9993_00510 [Vibrio lentus]|nr:hypothetical protein [Vibrio lentus]
MAVPVDDCYLIQSKLICNNVYFLCDYAQWLRLLLHRYLRNRLKLTLLQPNHTVDKSAQNYWVYSGWGAVATEA